MADALGFAVIVVGVAGTNWLWHLRRHPIGKCRWCGGTGQNRGSRRTRYGRCRHCKGGERIRVGAGLVSREVREEARRRKEARR